MREASRKLALALRAEIRHVGEEFVTARHGIQGAGAFSINSATGAARIQTVRRFAERQALSEGLFVAPEEVIAQDMPSIVRSVARRTRSAAAESGEAQQAIMQATRQLETPLITELYWSVVICNL